MSMYNINDLLFVCVLLGVMGSIYLMLGFHFFATKNREQAKKILGPYYDQWEKVGFRALFSFNPVKLAGSSVRADFGFIKLVKHILTGNDPQFGGTLTFIIAILSSLAVVASFVLGAITLFGG